MTSEPRHRVVFENPQFRILDVNIPPGTTLDRTYERDIVTVAMTSGAATVAEYAGKAGRHLVRNAGDTPNQLFAVENLRQGNWSSGVPLTAGGTTLALESRAFRVYDVKLARELPQIFHAHAAPTVAVLISGRAMSAGAESKTDPSAPIGLKQLVQAGEWVLVPAGESHHLVRLGTADARVIEIEVR